MKMTVNESFSLAKALRGRLGELSSLRGQCANAETFFGEVKKTVEPRYDMKVLDKKCVELENALLELDTKVKQSNAITTIEVDVDKNTLLAPLS